MEVGAGGEAFAAYFGDLLAGDDLVALLDEDAACGHVPVHGDRAVFCLDLHPVAVAGSRPGLDHDAVGDGVDGSAQGCSEVDATVEGAPAVRVRGGECVRAGRDGGSEQGDARGFVLRVRCFSEFLADSQLLGEGVHVGRCGRSGDSGGKTLVCADRVHHGRRSRRFGGLGCGLCELTCGGGDGSTGCDSHQRGTSLEGLRRRGDAVFTATATRGSLFLRRPRRLIGCGCEIIELGAMDLERMIMEDLVEFDLGDDDVLRDLGRARGVVGIAVESAGTCPTTAAVDAGVAPLGQRPVGVLLETEVIDGNDRRDGVVVRITGSFAVDGPSRSARMRNIAGDRIANYQQLEPF